MLNTCPSCGKEIPASDALFCAYCGASLAEKDAGTVCDSVYAVYNEYINWSSRFILERGTGNTLAAIFTGDREFKDRPEHKSFFDSCGKAAGELYGLFADGKCGSEDILKMLEYVLIDCHKDRMDAVEWMLLAAERHFSPFIPHLSGDEAAALYEPYRRLRRKNRGLPPQDEILKKLKKQR